MAERRSRDIAQIKPYTPTEAVITAAKVQSRENIAMRNSVYKYTQGGYLAKIASKSKFCEKYFKKYRTPRYFI